MIYLFQVLAKYIKFFKGSLSGLRQFLATESPLKMVKNGSYFTLKVHSKAWDNLRQFKVL